MDYNALEKYIKDSKPHAGKVVVRLALELAKGGAVAVIGDGKRGTAEKAPVIVKVSDTNPNNIAVFFKTAPDKAPEKIFDIYNRGNGVRVNLPHSLAMVKAKTGKEVWAPVWDKLTERTPDGKPRVEIKANKGKCNDCNFYVVGPDVLKLAPAILAKAPKVKPTAPAPAKGKAPAKAPEKGKTAPEKGKATKAPAPAEKAPTGPAPTVTEKAPEKAPTAAK